jgi:hypothetical protein
VNAYQVSISVDLSIDRGANGAPIVRVNNCVANVGFVDAYIDNGGLIGQIINSQFRVSHHDSLVIPNIHPYLG